jgi:hypothetical protein
VGVVLAGVVVQLYVELCSAGEEVEVEVENFPGEPAQQQGCLLASYGNAKYFNNLCCCWDWINSHSPENSSLEKKTRDEEHEGKLSQRGSRYATYILSSSQKKERKKERKEKFFRARFQVNGTA